MPLPLLVVVSGYDVTTSHLARAIAHALPCPAVLRDEIKEGLVYGMQDYTPERGDAVNHDAAERFFGLVQFLVDGGVTHVAHAAFQHPLWEHGLSPVLDRARVRVVRTHGDPAAAWERLKRHAEKSPERLAVHGYASLREPYESFEEKWARFEQLELPVPSIDVDIAVPDLGEIVSFLRSS